LIGSNGLGGNLNSTPKNVIAQNQNRTTRKMIQFFDIENYLQEQGIQYSEAGDKNVAQGWIGISCYECGDSSNHLGINLDSKLISCWKCGYKSSAISVVMYHSNCSYYEATKIVEETQSYEFTEERPQQRKSSGENIIPKSATKEIPDRHVAFLKNRRFSTEIIKRYQLQSCGTLGSYKNRIIIPIIIDNEVVSFTSIDTTGRQKVKYKHAPAEDSILPAKECVYGLDLVKDRMLLVEGITDAWRMGPGAVATLGMELSKIQINFIVQSPQKEIFIMFDGEEQAINRAHALAKTLSILGKHVEVIELSSGDPDDLTSKMVQHLRMELGL